MSKFFYHQILADRFVLNLKKWKTQGAIFSIDNLLLVIKSLDFCLALGQYPILNTTRVNARHIWFIAIVLNWWVYSKLANKKHDGRSRANFTI